MTGGQITEIVNVGGHRYERPRINRLKMSQLSDLMTALTNKSAANLNHSSFTAAGGTAFQSSLSSQSFCNITFALTMIGLTKPMGSSNSLNCCSLYGMSDKMSGEFDAHLCVRNPPFCKIASSWALASSNSNLSDMAAESEKRYQHPLASQCWMGDNSPCQPTLHLRQDICIVGNLVREKLSGFRGPTKRNCSCILINPVSSSVSCYTSHHNKQVEQNYTRNVIYGQIFEPLSWSIDAFWSLYAFVYACLLLSYKTVRLYPWLSGRDRFLAIRPPKLYCFEIVFSCSTVFLCWYNKEYLSIYLYSHFFHSFELTDLGPTRIRSQLRPTEVLYRVITDVGVRSSGSLPTCTEGYWGLQQGGCRRCECGAGAAACDPITGLCACAAGVGGAQCDTCLPGYYGFGPAGCLPCPKCSDGKVCSPDSGRCVCPPRSRGPGCKQCTPGYYSKPNTLGCHACRCGPGAISNQCDPQSGQCKCRIGWVGTECDRCALGHFGPRCRPCLCNVEGTKGCEDGVCPCDDEGRCPCKENVVGDKCDQCLQGTFGLSADSPSGCTACFCFGRATYCTQASLTRAAVHAATPQHITLLRGEQNMDIDKPFMIHPQHPDTTISLPWPPVPVYVVLDKRFLGDRVTSYGGALRFTVEEEGGEELPLETMVLFPLVKIEGNGIELNHYQRVPALNGTYAVRLHESLWEVRGQGALATRPALMAALQNVERILLRVTTRAPTYYDHVHALLLNVSLDTAIPGLSRSEPALGVELCECSEKYSAPSCQEPAIGFWLPRQRVRVTNVAGTIVINLEDNAQPCRCNGRAAECDPKTGACLNCTGGTGGPQCATCAEGYFGSPDAGGCQPCPCPSRTKNFASACAMSGGRLQCLCKPGYTGPECEWCASGFYRSPTGVCVPCACDPRGAASAHCDVRGRCRCRARATGDKCERCKAHREYMDEIGVCSPCDNCTQTLLDSVEALSNELRTRADPTELSRIPKPFPALLEFAHNTSQLQSSLQQLTEDLQNSNSIEPAIRNFEEREHILFTEANKLKSEASKREEESHYLSLESMSGLEEVLKQRGKLGDQVAALDDFARGEKHLSAHRALKEAKHLLRRIKDVKLIDFLGGATDVFDTATLQSTAVQEYDYRLEDVLVRVRKLQAALEEWERKADDLPRLGDTVWSAGDEVAAVEKRVRPKLAAIRDTALRCRLVLEDITSLSANNLTDEISSALLHGQTLAIKFPSMAAELAALTLAAEEKEGILYNLTPAYRQKYLEPVEKHVAELSEKAKQYKRVFSGARAAASLGVSAAHAWGGVADAVKDAREAADTAMVAVTAAATTFSRDSVPKAAASGISASNDLKRRGAELLTRSDELRSKLESLHRAADVVSVSLRALGWSERALAERPRAPDRVFGTTRALYDEAAEIRRRARYNLRRKLADLQRHGDTQLGAAEEHVSQIRGNTVRGAELAEALAAAAAARAREHAAAARTMDPALQALKDKIAKAKHAAQSISVSITSVSGGVGCSRSYLVTGASPAITRLAVAVSFEGQVRDGPMLHLLDDSQDNEKYMKLVVEKKRLKLTWDLGGGEAVIVHPEVLQSTHDDADQTSYRIEIERIWNTVHLRLERMGGGTPVSATNTSSTGAVQLMGSRLWLGGREGAGGLPGCVHALYFDDATVGLWNFQHQPKSAQCTGCTQRWYNSGSRSGAPLVWFNGAGYAELRRSGLRAADRRQFSVALTFRTRDENALLFMALDAANNRSVSLVLRDCRVVFLVQYSSSALEIAAGGRHCDGQPAHVHAIRLFAGNRLERGSLRVNGEETLGSASPPVQSAAALPDLAAARYWVAGTPPGAPNVAGAEDPPGLLGCIGALTVDREGYNLLDTPTRYGVEPTCDNRVLRSAILEGSGHIELPSPAYRRKAALGITFRARSADGLLLYRAPTVESDGEDEPEADDKHYLTLLLIAGELQVIAAAGKAELKLRTNGTRFDDGRRHSVRLIRAHKQLELWVDEEKVASGTLAGNAYPARTRGFFIGGVGPAREGDKAPGFPITGFTGTVADFVVDAQLQGFETAVSWSAAALGRADSALRAEPRAEPRALQAQPDDAADCTKTSSYTVEAGAVKFGDAPWSHAAVKLPPKVKELVITLQFRTYRPDGLLLLAPGSKAKPKHYLALLIREGKLRLIARGRKRRELALAAQVVDGTWRSVTVRVSRSRLSLSSGTAAAAARAPPLARAHRLLVGGLHAPPAPHTIPNSIVRIGGFVGCVRRVSVNGRGEDLVRDARSHHAVGQCFPNIEQAAYFAGDAYATWSNAWSFGEGPEASTEIRLQFRSGEPSGILLATRGLLLELKDGAVILTRYSWSGEERARVEARGPGGRALCDNRWHQVSARGAALTLDAGPELRAGPSATLHDDAIEPVPQTPAPLFIGGLPEGTTEWPDGGRENFKGCIRDVAVAGHKKDWPTMESLHSVLLDSCPVQ
ncbi:hypothetical protein ABMA28_013221 [Loxostege sticticalis]|uniref:Laminin subunit alpha-2 n=1 Tax=Loxostege sticticalis TaxID=481309 RepID=A0ABD0THQ8_LOXSC